ncbi:MAG: GNAT family N-acetyltransferase [Desulfobacteraceae bacterium]|nr:MAG: GNAT family N-acetyltransferase [Desulfobacteraceae bacterium]
MEIVEIEAFSEELRRALNALLPQLSGDAPLLTESALRGIIAAEATHLLMAVEDGRCCGTLTLAILTVLTGKRARIEDVVVSEAMRGRGIGRQLIRHALQLAREQGAGSVELTSHPSRQAANALYRKMGFGQRETNAYIYRLKE